MKNKIIMIVIVIIILTLLVIVMVNAANNPASLTRVAFLNNMIS